jgi:hypothetical protein
MRRERPVEHDSVVGANARNRLSISERVSGSGRLQFYLLSVAPQVYLYSFAAIVRGK